MKASFMLPASAEPQKLRDSGGGEQRDECGHEATCQSVANLLGTTPLKTTSLAAINCQPLSSEWEPVRASLLLTGMPTGLL